MPSEDSTTVGLSLECHEYLQRLKEDGVFLEMKDGYKFAIAYAIAKGLKADVVRARTVFNVGTLDPDGMLRGVITELFPDSEQAPYAMAERLAEAGVAELGRLHDVNQLRFSDIFAEIP